MLSIFILFLVHEALSNLSSLLEACRARPETPAEVTVVKGGVPEATGALVFVEQAIEACATPGGVEDIIVEGALEEPQGLPEPLYDDANRAKMGLF